MAAGKGGERQEKGGEGKVEGWKEREGREETKGRGKERGLV